MWRDCGGREGGRREGRRASAWSRRGRVSSSSWGESSMLERGDMRWLVNWARMRVWFVRCVERAVYAVLNLSISR